MRAVLDDETERFRAEVRSWIDAHRVEALTALARPEHAAARYNLSYGAWTGAPGELADAWEVWQAANLDGGMLCPHWPIDVGGRGWGAVRMAVWNEELAAAGMPRANRGLGEHLVGPAIIVHGTEEQRRFFLPRVISGEDVYGQGFSEPDAGSDLASLRTRGRIEGDEIVVDGEKLWTSLGHLANKLFVLCRTGPAGHRGLTYVLLDVADNGVEVRRTRQMTGAYDFTEERLIDSRAPLFNVIGGVDNGWRVAMTVLGYERGQMATVQHHGLRDKWQWTVEEARRSGQLADQSVRRRLAVTHAHIEAVRATGLRILAGEALEQDLARVSSGSKVYISELDQALARLSFEIRGADGLIRPDGPDGPGSGPFGPDEFAVDPWQHELLHARCLSIQGGTNEIQRNILGERVLGLPREPRVEAG